MKKLFYLFLFIGLVVMSCNKPNELPASEQEISFKATPAEIGFKSTTTSMCDENIPTTAEITIWLYGDETKVEDITVGIFNLNGEIFTQSFSLPKGTHSVRRFDLIETNQESLLIYTVPFNGSTYSGLVSQSLPFDLVVESFMKKELSIEVLCFNPSDYELYGFYWFALDITEVNSFCFFGDICIPDDDNDAYSADALYGLQNGSDDTPLSHDIPAIFKIKVFEDDGTTLIGEFDNEYKEDGTTPWLGVGTPLCVDYPTDEKVFFELWVYVLLDDGITFDYQKYHTWYVETATLYNAFDENGFFANDEAFIGNDGFLDFAIGSCVLNPDLPLTDPDPTPDPNTSDFDETAYARDADANIATCFTDYSSTANWGWSNGLYYKNNTYTLDLYAGAGQCDISAATLVGDLELIYNTDGSISVTYNADAGYEFDALHLYVGYEPYISSSFNPGGYPNIIETPNGVDTYTFNLSGFTNTTGIYIIAHADVVGSN